MRCPSVTTMTRMSSLRPVAEDPPDLAAIVRRDEEALRVPRDVRELPAGLADRRRVDERQDLLDVVDHRLVEQPLVPLLQRRQQHVSIDVPRQPLEIRHHALAPSRAAWRRQCGSSPVRPRRSRSFRLKAMDRLSVLSRRTSKPRFHGVLHRVDDRDDDRPPDREQDVADRVRHGVGERADVAAARFPQRVQPGRARLRAGEAAERHQRAHLQQISRGDRADGERHDRDDHARERRCWRRTRRRSRDTPRRREGPACMPTTAMKTMRPMSISSRCAGSGIAPNTG